MIQQVDGALARLAAQTADVRSSGDELALRANVLRSSLIGQARVLRAKLATAPDNQKETLEREYTEVCSHRALLDASLGSLFALSRALPENPRNGDIGGKQRPVPARKRLLRQRKT